MVLEESSVDTWDRQEDEHVCLRTNNTRSKMMKLKLPYFGHIVKRWASLENTVILGKK